jgi:hypothetical protein
MCSKSSGTGPAAEHWDEPVPALIALGQAHARRARGGIRRGPSNPGAWMGRCPRLRRESLHARENSRVIGGRIATKELLELTAENPGLLDPLARRQPCPTTGFGGCGVASAARGAVGLTLPPGVDCAGADPTASCAVDMIPVPKRDEVGRSRTTRQHLARAVTRTVTIRSDSNRIQKSRPRFPALRTSIFAEGRDGHGTRMVVRPTGDLHIPDILQPGMPRCASWSHTRSSPAERLTPGAPDVRPHESTHPRRR